MCGRYFFQLTKKLEYPYTEEIRKFIFICLSTKVEWMMINEILYSLTSSSTYIYIYKDRYRGYTLLLISHLSWKYFGILFKSWTFCISIQRCCTKVLCIRVCWSILVWYWTEMIDPAERHKSSSLVHRCSNSPRSEACP